jgi:hypothetical protein
MPVVMRLVSINPEQGAIDRPILSSMPSDEVPLGKRTLPATIAQPAPRPAAVTPPLPVPSAAAMDNVGTAP